MRLYAFGASCNAIRFLRGPFSRVSTRYPKLVGEIRQEASSVSLNLAEGRRRVGTDRPHHGPTAIGSTDEVRSGSRLAEARVDLRALRSSSRSRS